MWAACSISNMLSAVELSMELFACGIVSLEGRGYDLERHSLAY